MQSPVISHAGRRENAVDFGGLLHFLMRGKAPILRPFLSAIMLLRHGANLRGASKSARKAVNGAPSARAPSPSPDPMRRAARGPGDGTREAP